MVPADLLRSVLARRLPLVSRTVAGWIRTRCGIVLVRGEDLRAWGDSFACAVTHLLPDRQCLLVAVQRPAATHPTRSSKAAMLPSATASARQWQPRLDHLSNPVPSASSSKPDAAQSTRVNLGSCPAPYANVRLIKDPGRGTHSSGWTRVVTDVALSQPDIKPGFRLVHAIPARKTRTSMCHDRHLRTIRRPRQCPESTSRAPPSEITRTRRVNQSISGIHGREID